MWVLARLMTSDNACAIKMAAGEIHRRPLIDTGDLQGKFSESLILPQITVS